MIVPPQFSWLFHGNKKAWCVSKVGAVLCCPNFNWTSQSPNAWGKHTQFTLNRKHTVEAGFKWGPNRELSPWEASILFSPDISDSPLMMWISQQDHTPGRHSSYLKVVKPSETTQSYESLGNVACYMLWSTRCSGPAPTMIEFSRSLSHAVNISNNSTRTVAKKRRSFINMSRPEFCFWNRRIFKRTWKKSWQWLKQNKKMVAIMMHVHKSSICH